jgi:hypothetical protein
VNPRESSSSSPEELCAEAIRDGLATRVPARKRGSADTVAVVIGLGGSVISLLQRPGAIKAFCEWLTWRASKDQSVIHIRKRRNGEVTLGPDVNEEAALRFLRSTSRTDDESVPEACRRGAIARRRVAAASRTPPACRGDLGDCR